MGRKVGKHLMLFSVSGNWERASYGQVPPNATVFNDEFGSFYVVRAEVEVVLGEGPNRGKKAFLTMPARLEGSEALVTYNGYTQSTHNYEVSLYALRYISVETEVTEGFDEFSK